MALPQGVPADQAIGPVTEPVAAHALEVGDVLALVDSRAGGLTSKEVATRREAVGPNDLAPSDEEGFFSEMVESLTEPLQVLLIIVGILSALWGELRDAIAIFAIIGAVAVIETATDARTGRAIRALRRLAPPVARVLRDGQMVVVGVTEVVPGDVLVVEAGDVIAADARVLAAEGLLVDESALTGEAHAAAKSATPVAADAPLSARSSMLYAGTGVVAGQGRAVVTSTGKATEVGRLGVLVAQAHEPPTSLQRSMAELARFVLAVAVAVSITVPVLGVLHGRPVREMALTGLAMAFATIPEELPILVTVLLAIGGRRLAGRGALTRRLRTVESLGAVTVVLTDKTGTLTENRLRLTEVVGDRGAVLLVGLAAAPPDSEREPLETAVAEAAHSARVVLPGVQVVSFPFDPDRKRMSAVWKRNDGELLVAVKGAPESVLAACALADTSRTAVLQQAAGLAGRGLRVVAFAERTTSVVPQTIDETEGDLRFVGLAAFEDPLRPGVGQAVTALKERGVRTVIVTGDHPNTAEAVARQVGLTGPILLGGAPLDALDDHMLRQALGTAAAVARATPTDKLRLVQVLQDAGEVVAVTGDGVNDAPALGAADVGVAMGQRGTDLARQAAAVVLTDDAYPTVASAVEDGRGLRSQLRRAVAFYLGAKIALVLVMAVPLLLGRSAPFEPVHIVLLELFMDLGASVAFVSEPPALAPSDRAGVGRRFLDRAEVVAMAVTAAALAIGVLISYLSSPGTAGHTSAVASWLLAHVGAAWALRAQPGLGVRMNVFFPAWGFAAVAAGTVLAATTVGAAVELHPLTAQRWLWTASGVAATWLLAAAGRRAARLGRQL